MDDPLRFLRPDFCQLEEYTPVKPLDVLAAELNLKVDRLVKLDANENLYGVPDVVRKAIAEADYHIYPDPSQTQLRAAIARYTGTRPEQVVAGAGADDLIDIVLRLTMPKQVAIATPTFGMYSFLARISGAEPIEVPRKMPGWAVDVEGMAAGGAKLVCVCSPNNPTGNSLSTDEAEALCSLDALVVVDEAYAEFSGRSCIPLLERHSNLVILRTFSKWAGLAGLRVGYALAHPALAERMMAVKQPYNVNVAADVAARAALAHVDQILPRVRSIIAERERMAILLAETGWLRPFPSEANYMLFDVLGRDARAVRDGLRRLGVLVRHYETPELSGYIRITAARALDTERLVEALHQLEAA
ncbi:MAG: histidinol-phosphate transaminase [Dehalococcoidia bacterium]|nr:histidinol-phosphate transaminase [Dehalococcoidia bacterium]